MKKGFSATTFVLVAVLVGALFMVGRAVIPAPPGPPEPPPAAIAAKVGDQMVPKTKAPDAMQRAQMMKEMQKHQDQLHTEQKKKQGKKKFDPNQMEIKPAWNHDRAPGDEGNKEMAEMVAKAKAEQEAAKAAGHAATPTPGVKMAQ